MLRGNMSEKNLTRFSVVLFIVAAIAIAGVIYVLASGIQRSMAINQMVSNRAYCDSTVNDFSNTSDSMTYQVREYALDGDRAWMDAYWNEVEVNQTRDKAVQKLIHSNLTDQETTHVLRAKSYSDALIAGETWSFRLIAESQGMGEGEMPARVRAYKLDAATEALSADEKRQRAQAYLFGSEYETSKQNIRSTIQAFHADLTARVEASTAQSLSAGRTNTVIAVSGILLLMVLLVVLILAYSRTVKRKNAQLVQAAEEARAASEAKSYFTSRMSHEIRTPLNAMLGYLTLAEKDHDEDDKRADIGKSRVAAMSLLRIVNDVLDLAAIENGRMKLAEEPFRVQQVIYDLQVVYATRAEDKGVELRIDTDGLDQDYLIGDAQRTNQMLANLLSNAIKFTPQGGLVTLAITQSVRGGSAGKAGEGDIVDTVFAVSDTGIGMSPEFLPHVFEPYEQQDAEIGQKYGGTGLGLAIVKNMADMMGGDVEVTSVKDEGSTFTMTLPFKVASQSQAARLRDEAMEKRDTAFLKDEKPLDGMRLLLAEDNQMNIEIALAILTDLGAQVTCVSDGQEAVENFEEHAPDTYDAILMDVMMPRLNGYQAAACIRAYDRPDAKTVPIIAMTANVFASDVRKALDSGMDAHIAKPIDVNDMVAVLRRYGHTA